MNRRPALLALAVVVGAIGCSSADKAAAPPTTTGSRSPASSCTPSGRAQGGGDGGAEVNTPGDIPDNQAFVSYSPPDKDYTVKFPEGWARTEAPGTVSFTDKFNAIRIDLVDAPQAPTIQSTQDIDVPELTATQACLGGARVKSVDRKAGKAVLVTYQADSAPDAVTGKVVRDDVERYVFWKDGKSAVITLTSPAGSDNVDPWKVITDSFQWR